MSIFVGESHPLQEVRFEQSEMTIEPNEERNGNRAVKKKKLFFIFTNYNINITKRFDAKTTCIYILIAVDSLKIVGANFHGLYKIHRFEVR